MPRRRRRSRPTRPSAARRPAPTARRRSRSTQTGHQRLQGDEAPASCAPTRSTVAVVAAGQPLPPSGAAGSAAPDRLAPAAKLLGIADRQTFARGKGPRTLRRRRRPTRPAWPRSSCASPAARGGRCSLLLRPPRGARATALRARVLLQGRRRGRLVLPAAAAARAGPLRARRRRDRPRRQPRRRSPAGATGWCSPSDEARARHRARDAAGRPRGAAPAAAATVQTMVVGKHARPARRRGRWPCAAATVKVGGKRCAVGRATPLAALLGTGLRVRLRDYGSCGRRTRDAGGAVRDAGRRASATGAATAGSTRSGARPARPAPPIRRARSATAACAPATGVTWFWCGCGALGRCQRTLEVTPSAASGRAAARRCA